MAHAVEGFSFCKSWNSKTMCLFLEQHLPRPFRYFKEQGFKKEDASKLPFCILKREDRMYVPVKPPANGPTGKFYQDSAMGPSGGAYKNRKIILGQSSQVFTAQPHQFSHTCKSQEGRFPRVSLTSGNVIRFQLKRVLAAGSQTSKAASRHKAPARCGQSQKKV